MIDANGLFIYKRVRSSDFVYDLLDTIAIVFRNVLVAMLVFLNVRIFMHVKRTAKRKNALTKTSAHSTIKSKHDDFRNDKFLMILCTSLDLIIGNIPSVLVNLTAFGRYFCNQNGCFISFSNDLIYFCKLLFVFFMYYFNRLVKIEMNRIICSMLCCLKANI